MSQHVEVDKTLQLLVDNTRELLEGHGFELVTEDKKLFPYFTPSLAALKDGRLLVFSIAVLPRQGQFVEELPALQTALRTAVEGNTPESDPRVSFVERVALLLAIDDVEDQAPAGDIRWIGLWHPGELASKLRRTFAL